MIKPTRRPTSTTSTSAAGRRNDTAFIPSKSKNGPKKPNNPSQNSGYERRQSEKPSSKQAAPQSSRPTNQNPTRQPRPKQNQKTMPVDYNILVKKATPQAIEDYTAQKTFQEHGLNPYILQSLENKGYTQPTPIQDQVIEPILQSKDIIGIASTGTGKTAAFLLPLIHLVYNNPKKSILILAPTRELVSQIHKELKSFLTGNKITSTTIVGGESISNQIANLKKPKNFVIATTGRGLDLIDRNALNLELFDTVVLDEMDQMLDMGFIKDIRKILKLGVNIKHRLLFSATSSKEVEVIANEMLHSPVRISVSKGQVTDNVNQDVIEIQNGESKFDKLCELLSTKAVSKSIIFENTKHGASKLEKQLQNNGYKTLAIHGNKTQSQRTKTIEAFKSNNINILIATNVAARGLDIPLVSHVINYSLPQSKEDYIHRIGRTGRAGETGHAYTFVTEDQKNHNYPQQNPTVKKNKKARAREAAKK